MKAPLDERDQAQVARYGGRMYRRRLPRGSTQESDAFVKRDAEWLVRGIARESATLWTYGRPNHDTMIPQDAVTWPIYRAAIDVPRIFLVTQSARVGRVAAALIVAFALGFLSRVAL